MATVSRSFGRLGARIRVEFGEEYLTIKGSLGAERARVPIRDVETAVVQTGNLGAGPANMRQTYLQLIGHGTVLGQAAVNTMFGRARAAEQAAGWIRAELAKRR